MLKNDIFLKACKGQQVERTPVWFMRQAGRYLPDYRAIRSRYDFLTMCKTPEIASEITIQPINILGVDAAILFSDIMVVPEAMGMELVMKDDVGPKLIKPIRSFENASKLQVEGIQKRLSFVLDAIKLTKEKLEDRVPLIGFSGAPWTLMAYMVEGSYSKGFRKAKSFLYVNPELSHNLLTKISDSITTYLEAQIEAGVDVIQLFDSWSHVLAQEELRTFSLYHTKMVIDRIKLKYGERIPIILFLKGMTLPFEEVIHTGADVISLDWSVDIFTARKETEGRVTIQGNLDPVILLTRPEVIARKAEEILEKVGKGDRHIFNLGHGILPDTPVGNVKFLVDTIKMESRKYHKHS